MDKNCVSLCPSSLMWLWFEDLLLPGRSVSSVQTTISRHILPSAQPRSFKVCTHSRRRRRSLEASSLDELLQQVKTPLRLSWNKHHAPLEAVSEKFSGPDVSNRFVLFLFCVCISGREGVHVVLPLPDSGPGGGRDRGGLGGVLPVSAHQHATDGAGEGRHVDAEQGEHQVSRKGPRYCRYCSGALLLSVFRGSRWFGHVQEEDAEDGAGQRGDLRMWWGRTCRGQEEMETVATPNNNNRRRSLSSNKKTQAGSLDRHHVVSWLF